MRLNNCSLFVATDPIADEQEEIITAEANSCLEKLLPALTTR